MGDALRDLALNASNFSVGEYAPQKLALIPGDASGTLRHASCARHAAEQAHARPRGVVEA